jgi:hypothetical protein
MIYTIVPSGSFNKIGIAEIRIATKFLKKKNQATNTFFSEWDAHILDSDCNHG